MSLPGLLFPWLMSDVNKLKRIAVKSNMWPSSVFTSHSFWPFLEKPHFPAHTVKSDMWWQILFLCLTWPGFLVLSKVSRISMISITLWFDPGPFKGASIHPYSHYPHDMHWQLELCSSSWYASSLDRDRYLRNPFQILLIWCSIVSAYINPSCVVHADFISIWDFIRKSRVHPWCPEEIYCLNILLHTFCGIIWTYAKWEITDYVNGTEQVWQSNCYSN